jgi:hypothetical protein
VTGETGETGGREAVFNRFTTADGDRAEFVDLGPTFLGSGWSSFLALGSSPGDAPDEGAFLLWAPPMEVEVSASFTVEK